jgi:transcriptional regulator with XRE-family HTH domain
MNTNNQKLADFAAKKPSHWLKNAQHRNKNKKWREYSFQIAIKVLAAIDATPGMTQKQLAELIGVSPQFISKILKGQENLTLETISKIETALGIAILSFAEPEIEHVVTYNPVIFIPVSNQNKMYVSYIGNLTYDSLELKEEFICEKMIA